MRGKIEIELEVSDEHVAQDIIWMLEMQLPYIADNVIVRSSWGDELHRVDEPRGDDMTEEDADLHERDTLRRENPIRDLILKAWEAGKLRYQKEEPDLDRPEILDYSTTGMSGIEFQYNPEDDRILFAMRSIDGIDIEVDDLIEMMDREVNDGNLHKTWVVTEKTCVEAISEEQAISRVVNRVGNQEVIEMTAELGEE